MIISYNFGYYVPQLGGAVLGCSEIFTCKTFRQFADEVRKPLAIGGMMAFAEEQHVPRSSMCLLININNLHRFTIHMKNVREYKKAVDDWVDYKAEKKDKYWTE